MTRRTLLRATLLLLVAGCDSAPPPADGAGATGAGAAPALAGPSTEGGRFSLREVAGAPAVIVFVRGSYCPICQARLRALAAYAGAYDERGTRVVAVTLDPPGRAKATARELELPFPLVSADVATFQRWGLRPPGRPVPSPGDFVLDGAGRVRWGRVGTDAADRPSDVALLGVLDSLRAAGALPPR